MKRKQYWDTKICKRWTLFLKKHNKQENSIFANKIDFSLKSQENPTVIAHQTRKRVNK